MADPPKEHTLVQDMVRGNKQFDGPEAVQCAPDEHKREDGQAVEKEAHRRPGRGLRAPPEPFGECPEIEQGMRQRQETTRPLPIFACPLGFQRLFTDQEYSEFLEFDSDLSNVLLVRGGASIQATEAISVSGVVSWFQEDEALGIFGPLSPNNEDGVGIEVGLYASYDYSEDLSFNTGYAHLFSSEDLSDGAAIAANGFSVVGGGDDDADYFFLETSISF